MKGVNLSKTGVLVLVEDYVIGVAIVVVVRLPIFFVVVTIVVAGCC